MKKVIMFSAVALLLVVNAGATDILSVQSGSWASPATWDGGVLPTASDMAIIEWDDWTEVDTAYTVGALQFGGGGAKVTVKPSGTLNVNGQINHWVKEWPQGVYVDGGTLNVGGDYRVDGGGNGAINSLNVSSGTANLAYLELGWWAWNSGSGEGKGVLNLLGSDGTITLSQNFVMGEFGGLNYQVASDGTVTPVTSQGLGGSASVTVNGELIVDLSAMAAAPAEIVLIDNGGVDAISGVFDSVSITGASGYTLNYAGGDGNDLTVVIPEPGTIGLLSLGGLGLFLFRRRLSM